MDNRMTVTSKQKWEEKQLYGRFKRLINISHDKTWTWLKKKANFKRETESLKIAPQNNAIKTKEHIRRSKIATVSYVVTETKPSIT